MRKSDLKKNHVPLNATFARYRAFMDKIINAQRVISTTDEKRDIAESVLLRLCAYWERFIDEHLVDCVNRDHTKLSTHFAVTIPANPSWELCHALIIGASYKDFRSFGDLKGFSKKTCQTPATRSYKSRRRTLRKSTKFIQSATTYRTTVPQVHAL